MPTLAPRLAVVIGIDHYRDGIPALKNAVRDARAISAVLAHHGCHADDGTLIQLLDGDATHDALHQLFTARLPELVGPEHRVIVYFAGHGQALPDDERVLRGFLLPIDAAREGRTRYLAMDVVRGALAALPCHHLFVALDCCSAGAFARPRYRDVLTAGDEHPPLIRARFEALQRRRAFQLLASASHDERALDSFEAKVAQDALGEHSPFARAVIDALTPPSVVDRDRDGVITATEIYIHARRVLEAIAHQQTPNLWPLEWHDGGESTFLFGEPRFFVPRALTREESPYRGLEPFREDDARIFFGRREAARALADRIRASPLVAVVGPSGAGKTSLLRAGVIPLLRAGAVVCEPVRPGASPLAALAGALAEVPADDPRPVVLIIDPLEELVTMKASADERASLLALLRAATAPPGEADPPPVAPASFDDARIEQLAVCARKLHAIRARLHLVLAMRSDYAALFADEFASPEGWAHARHVVPPMKRDELRDCIELPAADRFLVFAPDPGPGGARLVETLLDEVEQMPGGLPLLSVALDEMFRAYVDASRDDRTLGWDEHRAIGGIDGALRQRAEDVYAFAACTRWERVARQASLRELMLRLISFEAGALARRRVRRSALELADAGETRRMKAVLAALIDARLVVADGDVIELAHDSLIHGWPRVLSWIDPGRAALLDRLAAAAAEWTAAPRARKTLSLWDDERLAELHALVPDDEHLATRELLTRLPASTLNRDERAFVDASDRARRRRRTRVRAVVAAVVLMLTIAALYSQAQRATAEEQRGEAESRRRDNERQLARAHKEAGRQLLLEGHPAEAMPYLISARQKGEEGESLQMLISAATRALPIIPLLEHQGRVSSAAFSPDGTRVVTASEDNTARIWDVATGEPLTPPLLHQRAVRRAAFSPDGTRVVTASEDKTARVWDAATGKPLTRPLRHNDLARYVVFSPNSARLVTLSSNTVRIWDTGTGIPLTPLLKYKESGGRGSEIVAFSPDSTRVVTASDLDNNENLDNTAHIWEAATGTPLAAPLQHQGVVKSIAFSPDGTRIVTASCDNTARIWDAATGKPLTPPLEHQECVLEAVFSPDGARVLTASYDTPVRIWDSATGKPLASPFQHREWIEHAVFSPDGTRVVTNSSSVTRVWDVATGKPLTPPIAEQSLLNATFSPDGTRIVTACNDHAACVWSASNSEAIASQLDHGGPVHSAAFSPDGTLVVTAGANNTAHIWDTATGLLLAPALQHEGQVLSAAFGPDGTRVITASDDNTARLWDTATGMPRTFPLQHRDIVVDAAFSPDGTRVVTASHDSTACIWDTVTGMPLAPPLLHRGKLNSLAFSPDGTLIVTASEDYTARIWVVATGMPFSYPLQHADAVKSASFSPDGTRVITASEGTARVWDVATGMPLPSPLKHQGSLESAAFSRDGTRVLTTSSDTAHIWDVKTGTPLVTPLAHQGWVRSAAFSPDGTRVVTASMDGTARIWDAITGKPLTSPLKHKSWVVSATFSPDGTRVVTASIDSAARIWETPLDDTPPAEWAALAARSPFMLSGGVPVRRAPPARRADSH